jgi:hypothetical protein
LPAGAGVGGLVEAWPPGGWSLTIRVGSVPGAIRGWSAMVGGLVVGRLPGPPEVAAGMD